MSLGEGSAVVCLGAISNEKKRTLVVQSVIETGRVIVEITLEQVGRFAGNMLFVRNVDGGKLLVH